MKMPKQTTKTAKFSKNSAVKEKTAKVGAPRHQAVRERKRHRQTRSRKVRRATLPVSRGELMKLSNSFAKFHNMENPS